MIRLTLPSRVDIPRDPTPANYQVPVMQNSIDEIPKIVVWEMSAGKVTKLKMKDEIIVVRENLPEDITAEALISAATRFFKLFNIKRSVMLNKAIVKPEEPKKSNNDLIVGSNLRGKHAKIKLQINDGFAEDGESVGMIANMTLYKNRIIEFYRKNPECFDTDTIKKYIMAVYDGIADATADNRGRGYVRFMLDQGYIKSTAKTCRGRRASYEFIKAPYDEPLPAQAEFDPEYEKERKLRELDAMRREM